MNENTTTVLSEVRELNYIHLANEVSDITGPNDESSDGAKFLTLVRDALVEALEWRVEHDDDGDLSRSAQYLKEESHELADGAVPVYTYNRWLTFVDLAAWQIDISEYGESEDMTSAAGVALYEVARILIDALCDQVLERWFDLQDDGEQDDDEDQDLDADPVN